MTDLVLPIDWIFSSPPLPLSILSAVISLSKVLLLLFKTACYAAKVVINQPGLEASLRNELLKAGGGWGLGTISGKQSEILLWHVLAGAVCVETGDIIIANEELVTFICCVCILLFLQGTQEGYTV